MFLNQNFGSGGPRVGWGSVNSDFFTARYTSQMYVSNPGTLYFSGNSDDGMRLYLYRLDGKNFGNVDPNDYQRYPSQKLWEHWYRKPADPARPYTASQYVTPGLYGITVEYYEFDGLASVEMSISGNGSVVTPPPPPPPPPGNNGGENNGGGNQETPRPSCANTDKWYANFYSGDILSGGSWRDSTPLSQISTTYAGSELSQFRTNWDNDGNPGQDTGQPTLRFNSHEMGPNSGVYTATFSTILPGHGRYRVTLGVKGFAKGSIRLFEGETVRNKDVKPSQDNQSKSSMSWSKQEYNIQGCRQIVVRYVDYAPGQGRDANNADLTVSFTKH